MSEVKRRCVIVTGTRRVPSDLCMWGEIMSAVDGAYLVITGGCSGVDQAAGYLATTVLGLDCLTIPAQWERDGRAAGPIRNQAMIDIAKKLEGFGYEVEGAAFPYGESRGTRGCIRLMRKAGISVKVVELTEADLEPPAKEKAGL